MPSTGYNPTNTFQNQAGPIPLSQLDVNFTQAATALNTLTTFSNYFLDSSGAANTIVVTVPSPLVFAYTTGVRLQIKLAFTNTSGTVQVNVNALGAKTLVNSNGSALAIGQIVANQILDIVYDGTNFQILGSNPVAVFTSLQIADGTAAAPSLSFSADTNTGIYRSGADDLGIAAGGTGVILAGSSRVQSSVVHWFADGSAANPSLSFFNDGNTGWFRNGSDDMRATTGGVDRLSINNSFISVDAAIPFYFADGAVGTPALSFLNDSNTGIYRIGSDDMGFSTGGSLRFEINSSGTVLYGGREVGYRNLVPNGQNAGYTFVLDDNGRAVTANTAGNFTVNNSVFSGGHIITFINTTGSNCTLVQGSGVTFRLMGVSGTTGNRTVADFGVATIIAQNSSVFLVGGPGVS